MNQLATIEDHKPAGVIASMSRRFDMDPRAFEQTLRATVIPKETTKEQFAAFLLVAKEYDLNPITKEIYAFPSRNGIQPIVSIDGWMKLMNSHPEFDGIEFDDHLTDDGRLISITAKVFRKDRTHPISVTEYLTECQRNTDPWKQYPRRMLRHKAAIQAARYAFGFSGIVEPDEAERIDGVVVSPPPISIAPPVAPKTPRSAPKAEKTEQKQSQTNGAEMAAKPEPVEVDPSEIRSPDEVLSELENMVSGIESETDLDAVWSEYQENPALSFPGDMSRAQGIIAEARERITA